MVYGISYHIQRYMVGYGGRYTSRKNCKGNKSLSSELLRKATYQENSEIDNGWIEVDRYIFRGRPTSEVTVSELTYKSRQIIMTYGGFRIIED